MANDGKDGWMGEADAEAHRQARYREMGIDAANPNPDGSDYRLMMVVEDEIAGRRTNPA